MKARRSFITEKLLAVLTCLAIVFSLVPWSAQSAYASADVNFRATNITLGEAIGMNFFFDLANGVIADTVNVTCGGEEINLAMPTTTQEINVNGEIYPNCYKVTVKVPAQYMADTISIQLYKGTETVGEPYITSVKAYAETIINSNIYSDNCKALVRAMLNYGSAVQIQLGNTANLANPNYDKYQLLSVTDVQDIEKNLPEGVTASINVSYKSTTTLIVKLRGLAANTDITCDEKPVNISINGDYTVVEINGIMASEITKPFTVNVGTGTLKVSVSNYCYLAQGSTNESVANVAKALHAYGVAASTYAANPYA